MKTQVVEAKTWEEFVAQVKSLCELRGQSVQSFFGLKAIAGCVNGYTHTKYVWKEVK